MHKIQIAPVIRGYLDRFHSEDGKQVELGGWIFREDTPIDTIDITLQGKPWISSLPLHDRPDVKAAYESIIDPCSHSTHCGFVITAPLPEGVKANSSTIVEISPVTPQGLRLDPLRTYCSVYPDELEHQPKPPIHLQHRIGESDNFMAHGVQMASLILTCAGKYKPVPECEGILDWGCGCGRVIAQLRKFVPPERLHGCDIDSEAIEWDRQNISGANFVRIDPYPPTPYSDASFDLVYGFSVMTHLDEKTQFQWLNELRRISRPGATLALTVISGRLRSQRMPTSLLPEFEQNGFAAFVPDYSDSLREFSHQGYYQETYHSVDYIVSNWGHYFDVLEYVETKHQDIVILRKV